MLDLIDVVTLQSTLGLVSAWVDDRLWTGKPPRPTQPEPALWTRWNEYPAKAGGVNRHIA